MFLIAFASNFKNNPTVQAPEKVVREEPEQSLLNTGFRAVKPKSDQVKIITGMKEDAVEISTHPLDQLKNLFERLQEELAQKKLARAESLELETLIDLNELILKRLATNIVNTPLKELIISAVAQQKEIIDQYLRDDPKALTAKEKQSLQQSVRNLDQNLNLLTEQNTQATKVTKAETQVVLDPLAYSFHDRTTLLSATRERANMEIAAEQKQAETIKQEARKASELRVLREYLGRLETEDSKINFISALYRQRQDPAILTLITEELGASRVRDPEKNKSPNLALAN